VYINKQLIFRTGRTSLRYGSGQPTSTSCPRYYKDSCWAVTIYNASQSGPTRINEWNRITIVTGDTNCNQARALLLSLCDLFCEYSASKHFAITVALISDESFDFLQTPKMGRSHGVLLHEQNRNFKNEKNYSWRVIFGLFRFRSNAWLAKQPTNVGFEGCNDDFKFICCEMFDWSSTVF